MDGQLTYLLLPGFVLNFLRILPVLKITPSWVTDNSSTWVRGATQSFPRTITTECVPHAPAEIRCYEAWMLFIALYRHTTSVILKYLYQMKIWAWVVFVPNENLAMDRTWIKWKFEHGSYLYQMKIWAWVVFVPNENLGIDRICSKWKLWWW